MKKLGKLNLLKNAEVLEKSEMKKVIGGGSWDCGRSKYGYSSSEFLDVPPSLGYSWCAFWHAAGWTCRCVSNY
ncbi:TIGR04149 family rSAM-modified RiPP [Bacteroides sp. 519]|uniref:TIGR04149 family rSAM-modified RiPP n=1 Tax=Bacteroides sp. 519 TaxID=2302937 RepID=UPI0013D0C169|nr:rSAM-modified peptide [Bacteroides sp. 519]